MNVGLVVEGPTDEAAYPELIRKIRTDVETLQVRPCGGKSRLKGIFANFLGEFHRNRAWQIETALVIQDSDCLPSQQVEDRLRLSFTASLFPALHVEFFAPKCDLETWLVADENAINRVSRERRKNTMVNAVEIQLEVSKAEELFSQQLSKAHLSPVPAVYAEIAKSLDIGRIAALCPSFRRFIEVVRSC
jgi:hypothetical protein